MSNHAAVLRQCCCKKTRSPLETINDLNDNVVNFFQVLRDRRDELINKIQLTPWARSEYKRCLCPADDPIEKARRFYASACMSFNGATRDDSSVYGWRNTTDHRLRASTAWDMQNGDLDTIAKRLIGVQIECRDWREVTTRLDNDQALIYMDPPYVQEERTKGFWYSHEWTDTDHTEAADLLRQCAGYVVVSGYACPLYTELYEAHGWHRVDKEAQTNSGGKRIESLWLSPRTLAALNDSHNDLPLFA